MKAITRRAALQSGAALAAGTLAACASTRGDSGGDSNTLFDVPQPSIPIANSRAVFPVRRIYCIGRNYAAHAREMGSDPSREPPFFFQKPSDAVQFVPVGKTIDHAYPTLTKNYHYELELVAALNTGGRNIAPERALACVYGYAVGLDMTRRDLQRAMGEQKKPWEIGKSFDHAAPIGPIHPVEQVGHFTRGAIVLKVNGAVKQSADLSQMIWNVAEQIANLSQAFELFSGRHHLLGHSRERRPGGAGRRDAGAYRWSAGHFGERGLTRASPVPRSDCRSDGRSKNQAAALTWFASAT